MFQLLILVSSSDIKYACKCLAFITISFTAMKTIFQGALCCKRQPPQPNESQYAPVSTIEAQVLNERSNPGFETIGTTDTNPNYRIGTNHVFDLSFLQPFVSCVQANPNLKLSCSFSSNGIPTIEVLPINWMRPIYQNEASAPPPNYSDACAMPRV